METITAKISGMDCAACALTIEKKIKKVPGIADIKVNYATEEAIIQTENKNINLPELENLISPLGYHFLQNNKQVLTTAKEEKLKELNIKKLKVQITLPLAIIIFVMMLWEIAAKSISGTPMFPVPEEIMAPVLLMLSSVVLFWVGLPFVKAVGRFIRYRAANMDTLIGIGTLAAYIYSSFITLFPAIASQMGFPETKYFDVVVIVISFVFLGKYLEARSKMQTGEAIEKLINLQPKTATVIKNGKEEIIPISEVKMGDILLVKPGAKIPVDGLVIEGFSAVDESMITGESIPKDKKEGDSVIGGTINENGVIKIKALKVGSETMLANIIKMVESAQGSRAPIQKLADKISGVFVPVVLGISVLTFLIWIIIGSQFMPFSGALTNGLLCFVGVLVIACPCALGLATPTAIIVGVGKGAEKGILIKNAESLEKLGKVTAVVVDKTGTITKGEPEVTDTVLLDSMVNEADAFKILASLEKNSDHPIARAINKKAEKENIKFIKTDGFKDIPGKGLYGVIDGKKYFTGNIKFAEEKGININSDKLTLLLQNGKSPIVLFDDKKAILALGVADVIKDASRDAVKNLHTSGLKVIMLTGDNEETAKYIAGQVGIDEVIAGILPGEKAQKISDLQKRGYIVAMAGDGINDAPALAQSDVGIAMGNGTDVAMETADITLLNGDITKINQAIKLSKQTMATIKQNLFWAFFYNLIGIPLAAGLLFPIWGILLNPIFAGLAMTFSSVSVVSNSLRLKLKKL